MKIVSFRNSHTCIICIVILSSYSCKTSQSNTNEIGVFVGSISSVVIDKKNNLSFPILINYPTLEKSNPTKFGPYTIDVSVDAILKRGKFPLVIISHGNDAQIISGFK